MYYRYSNNENPMSDFGHAMFVSNAESTSFYGKICYTFDGAKSVKIDDLKSEIVSAWVSAKRNLLLPEYELSIKLKDLLNSFNPADIVNSAEAWDNGDLVQWIYEQVLEPNKIFAVTTQDGAIVFDKNLIKKA